MPLYFLQSNLLIPNIIHVSPWLGLNPGLVVGIDETWKPEIWGWNLTLPPRLGFEKTKLKSESGKPEIRGWNSTLSSRLGVEKTKSKSETWKLEI